MTGCLGAQGKQQGLDQQLLTVMQQYNLLAADCTEAALLSFASEVQHRLFNHLFVPSLVQARLKSLCNCVFTLGIPISQYCEQPVIGNIRRAGLEQSQIPCSPMLPTRFHNIAAYCCDPTCGSTGSRLFTGTERCVRVPSFHCSALTGCLRSVVPHCSALTVVPHCSALTVVPSL